MNGFSKILIATGICFSTASVFAADKPYTNGGGGGTEEVVSTYYARLRPLNSRVTGWVRFRLRGDEFNTQLTAMRAAPSIMHIAHIHAGTRCPTMAADKNKDGYVDVIEGLPDYGAILVPLDGDLSSQDAGHASSPVANAKGRIRYTQTTSYSAMLSDLHAMDPNPNDAIVKLKTGEELRLTDRHVVVHGVASSTVLPSTVQSLPGAPAQATLPIACGQIYQVQK